MPRERGPRTKIRCAGLATGVRLDAVVTREAHLVLVNVLLSHSMTYVFCIDERGGQSRFECNPSPDVSALEHHGFVCDACILPRQQYLSTCTCELFADYSCG